jgi:hypothetical protein
MEGFAQTSGKGSKIPAMSSQRKRFDDELCFNVSRKHTDVLVNCTD